MDRFRFVFCVIAIFVPLGLSWLTRSEATAPVNARPAVTHQLPARQALARDWDVEVAYPGLQFSNALILKEFPASPNEWLLVERTGRVFAFENNRECQKSRIVLDLTQRLGPLRDKEQGVLGLACHPNSGMRIPRSEASFLSSTRASRVHGTSTACHGFESRRLLT